ncbi:MAG: hypothetical protein WC278_03715 [Bacilli bacterium]|jgi:predicted membrane channel-forming protein YqfA (hemolysin III family)|nr:hypothetical protein [Bacilli bacterium]MDD2682005.1 hypothetical protein [Bacilli bacterium]MDD3121161.1 hypothetical protein [Bacilli bacterium]MDD4063343.1 hypothetical protein [Bacilli bacterium]MDD4482601.1 hypothetical protein [Bacilli bacterium]
MSKKTKNRIFASQVIIGFAVVMVFLALVIIFGFEFNSDALETGFIFIGFGVILFIIGLFAYKRYKEIGEKELSENNEVIDDEDDDKLN